MSHEIRTPMTGIIGMSDLLLDTPLSDEQRQFAGVVRESSEALLNIINDILDFSKIEAGKLTLETVAFNPVLVTEGAAELLAARAREKQLSLMTFIAPEIPTMLLGDPGRLRQVLLNLLGNAVKFTARGEVVLRATLDTATDAEATVRFAISDTGIGLSPAARARLFQPFMQADSSTTRQHGGTGLGLAISKRMVELMGGEIGVESAEGAGSTFWFTATFARATDPAPPRPLPDLGGLRVLVVDDNPTNREIVHHYVISWGMRNGSVASGPEALALLRQAAADGDPYDLAITDMAMPEMDGFALARAIGREPALAATRLILLTAFDERGQGEQALRAGFAAYLTKPVRQSQLFDAIASAIAGKAAGQVALGRRDEPSVQVATDAPATDAAEGTGTPPAHRPILLAEDNPVNQKVALRQLEKLGYAVHAVANGREAVEALTRNADRYRLVLMDCQMPEMDGLAATKAIRKVEITSGRHIPIIAMTANAMQGDRETCLAVGMDDYISKPVNRDELRAILDRWMPPPGRDERAAAPRLTAAVAAGRTEGAR